MQNELTQQNAEMVLSATGGLDNWLDPEKFNHLARVSAMLAKSSIVPSNYQGKPEDCMIAMDMASRMNMNPLAIMQSLYVVKGKPSWSGQACASLIMNCGRFSDVQHVRTGEIGEASRGCYYTAISKETRNILRGIEVTIAMASAEGWTANPKWKNMPELMLMYRAASFFAKEFCPDVLMGVQTDVEVEDSFARPHREHTALSKALME